MEEKPSTRSDGSLGALAAAARELVQARAAAGEFSGVVRLSDDSGTIFQTAVGPASRSWHVPNTIGTRFRIASISKMFTAVAVLQLVEEGRLQLEEGAVERLELSGTRLPREATVRDLLAMTSGMADWFDESGDWETEWAELCRRHPIYLLRRNADYLPLFADKEPIGPVGGMHRYNGAGYILLGLLIERISGLDYFEQVRRRVFVPAGMMRSDFLALDDPLEDTAEGYVPVRGPDGSLLRWKRNIYSITPEAAADGGATSTAEDLCRFSRALRQGLLLSPEMTARMLGPAARQSPEPVRGYDSWYGFGCFLLTRDERIVRWGHTGEEDGVSARLYHYPEQGIDLVILGNQSWCAGDLGWDLHEAIVKA